ncbi:4-hydroxy-tetrahydrodipicolinate reductase [Demequina zhanjiangensis]|uniref:4-hydroxy-tetrahydrodipicolinate reductase n=1 Tax=Demequina zhanjiangensis TaxID=3051659 RepID=A0ABT8G3A3_9MICO|nr:4-hydroxy-tetrahydrodipicolinate reductase [Demequina sp. SYSU T00b26]MDN4473615.1 4-hydroxy-tetrahydrodipicolinate reductase [Demequina sp. SYSU T00b26]
MINVAVLGASGRMGATTCRAVESAEDMALVAALDAGDEVAMAVRAGAEVMVDFTVPSATEANVHAAIEAGLHCVVGTTGWTADALARVDEHLKERPELGVLIAPNFALGAVLAMRLSAAAARYFESVEIVELHHPDKVDAPSGTARHTAAGIAAARATAGVAPSPDATTEDPDGARGAVVDGIHVHAVRLRGLVAHEEIMMGNPGEQFTIRTDSFDRVSFMPGVLLGVREVAMHPGLTVGLDGYMSL